MPENPYEPPLSEPSPVPRAASRPRKSRIGWIALASLVGAVLGSDLFAPFVRGPGDPYGNSIGAGLGGFLGLAVGIVTRVLAGPRA
jgi:hypothetical protein